MRKSETVCDLPADTGMCRGYFPKFYFDKSTGSCREFIYGGCGGNENNFERIDECEETCGNNEWIYILKSIFKLFCEDIKKYQKMYLQVKHSLGMH